MAFGSDNIYQEVELLSKGEEFVRVDDQLIFLDAREYFSEVLKMLLVGLGINGNIV